MITPAELQVNPRPPMPLPNLALSAEPLAAPADETEDTPEFLDCGRDI
ncbi:MAG TPA: hypothetical protein VKE70_09955 [Candidatus Solibacter sp.]|nr:hypothetical protein [Candidatus Solibacter sp.]